MHKKLKTIQLKDINVNDPSFVVTEGRDNVALQGAIVSCGLLQPPCLWRSRPEAPYVIVCGYLRMLAVRKLGWQELSAWVFDPDTPQASLLESALQDNLPHRIFNPVETACALQRLLTCFPRDTVITEWLPRFGLSASGRVLNRFLCLCSLEQEPRAALIAGSITEASALRFSAYSAEDRLAIFALMQQLHLSAGKQSELLECLEDLSRRDKTTLRDAASTADIARVCSETTFNRVQKTEQVRNILRTRRFPRLHAVEDRFAAALKDLHIPTGIRIMPPPHFEGRTFKAEIAFTSADELRQRGRELLLADRHQAFERLCAEKKDVSAYRGDTR
jgi:hypothetical protein